MSQIIRAKLRCLEQTRTWEGHTLSKLAPVMPRRVCGRIEPDGAEENEAFWKASPSGELHFCHQGCEPAIEPGKYYYVDLHRLGDDEQLVRPWKLWRLVQISGSLTVQLGLEYDHTADLRNGSLELCIDNEGAWGAFEGHLNSRWELTLSEAT